MNFYQLKLAPRHLLAVAFVAIAGCTSDAPQPTSLSSQYLYLWTASADETQPDFLAILDVTENGARYGKLVTTLR